MTDPYRVSTPVPAPTEPTMTPSQAFKLLAPLGIYRQSLRTVYDCGETHHAAQMLDIYKTNARSAFERLVAEHDDRAAIGCAVRWFCELTLDDVDVIVQGKDYQPAVTSDEPANVIHQLERLDSRQRYLENRVVRAENVMMGIFIALAVVICVSLSHLVVGLVK